MRTRLILAVAVVAVMAGAAGYAVARHDGASNSGAAAPTQPVVPSPSPRPRVLSDLSTSAPMPSQAALSAAIGKEVKPAVAAARVVGLVVDGFSGRVLYSRGAQTLAPPASTTKLLTAAVALQELGPSFSFTTSTTRVGNTLYLVGGGDPTVLRADSSTAVPDYPQPASYADLAQRTAAALGPGSAVKLRIDTSLEDGPTSAPGWLPNYVTEGDVTPPSALELDEGRLDPTNLDSERTPTPAAQAASTFAALLATDGVHVKGKVRAGTAPPTAQAVANVQSPPLNQLVQRMLTVSDNDLAEALGRAIARHDGADPSFTGAATSVISGLKAFGVAPELVSLDDTSGLSHADRIAPQALIDVLRAATSAQHPALRSIVEGLPIGGLTGTLSDRYRDKADRGGAGVVRAKTGTLMSVNTLAGLVVDRDGRLLMFALMASKAAAPAQTLAAIDQAAASLAACGCGSQPTS